MRLAIAALVLAACSGPRFLGEPLPAPCGSSFVRCSGELELRGWRDEYTDHMPALERYVAGVEARIARASTLDYMPTILVLPTGEAAVESHTIILGRSMIVRLGSEAELAAILAHETAHLEAKLGETSYLGSPVDEESLADERGVELLARAGYPRPAMASALQRVLTHEDDPGHPPPEVRIRRTTLLAGDRRVTDDTRPALLAAIAGSTTGRERETGTRVGTAWVITDRDLVVPPPPGLAFDDADAKASAHAGRTLYSAWRLGRLSGRGLIARLAVVERFELPVGRVTIGTVPRHPDEVGGSLERLVAQRTREIVDLEPGELGAVIETPGGSVLLTVTDSVDQARVLERWVRLVRAPTEAEQHAATSPRVVLVPAPRTATVRELAATCVDPAAALELDDPDRTIAAGALVKCTDRR